jgi:hypothetical protein
MHFLPLLHYHAFGARDAFMCITVCMHSERDAYSVMLDLPYALVPNSLDLP